MTAQKHGKAHGGRGRRGLTGLGSLPREMSTSNTPGLVSADKPLGADLPPNSTLLVARSPWSGLRLSRYLYTEKPFFPFSSQYFTYYSMRQHRSHPNSTGFWSLLYGKVSADLCGPRTSPSFPPPASLQLSQQATTDELVALIEVWAGVSAAICSLRTSVPLLWAEVHWRQLIATAVLLCQPVLDLFWQVGPTFTAHP